MAAGRRSVVWAESARAALDDVVTYIAQDSREAAVRVLVAALDTARSLDQHAERGRIVPELNQPDLRELFVFDYRLLYRVRSDEVVVVAYLHGARDFATWRGSSVAVPATNPCSAAWQEIYAHIPPPMAHLDSRSMSNATRLSCHCATVFEPTQERVAQSKSLKCALARCASNASRIRVDLGTKTPDARRTGPTQTSNCEQPDSRRESAACVVRRSIKESACPG